MKFVQAAMAQPEVFNAFTPFQSTVPQRFMDIDKEKALKLGVNLNDLYQTIGAFMGGSYVNDFTRFGRLYKTYIQAEPEYRVDESQINNFNATSQDCRSRRREGCNQPKQGHPCSSETSSR